MADNKKQFEALFNYATIGIIVTDEKGTIINFNKQAEKDFGYTTSEITGKAVEHLLPANIKAKHEHYREGFYNHPSARAMGQGRDLFAQRKDGSVFPVEVSLSNYTLNNELFVLAFVIDITIRKQNESSLLKQKIELENVSIEIKKMNAGLEQKVQDRTKMLRETLGALEQSRQDLSEALQAEKDLGELKSRFVSMASHEFKTPLSAILSSAFLLEKYNDLDEKAKRFKHIQRIKNAVNEMRLILDDFLSLDRLDEGSLKADMKNLPGQECFQEIEATISEMQLNVKAGQQIRIVNHNIENIFIDSHLLKNILVNLLSNAIKFSSENELIEVSYTNDENHFIISIKDNGIGISTDDQQHLFERFYRAKNAFNIQGTGLGLHIVKKYVELMNGYIEIKSELNKGTIVLVYIPQPTYKAL